MSYNVEVERRVSVDVSVLSARNAFMCRHVEHFSPLTIGVHGQGGLARTAMRMDGDKTYRASGLIGHSVPAQPASLA